MSFNIEERYESEAFLFVQILATTVNFLSGHKNKFLAISISPFLFGYMYNIKILISLSVFLIFTLYLMPRFLKEDINGLYAPIRRDKPLEIIFDIIIVFIGTLFIFTTMLNYTISVRYINIIVSLSVIILFIKIYILLIAMKKSEQHIREELEERQIKEGYRPFEISTDEWIKEKLRK